MIGIRPLTHFDRQRFVVLAGGYTTTARYRVERQESDELVTFRLTLEPIALTAYNFPYHEEELDMYTALVAEGHCWGVYDGQEWIGVAIGEPRHWNNTLWLWEFHIDERHRGEGIGRRLMAAVFEKATAAGFRAVGLETQNTNVPAIRFYRALGFTLDGVNVSFYTNDDTQPNRTLALFMQRRLTQE